MKKWGSVFILIWGINSWGGETPQNTLQPNLRQESSYSLASQVQQLYDETHEELQKLPFEKEVEVLYHKYRTGFNLPLSLNGHHYEIPLLLLFNSSKRAFGFSAESGTLLPKGKTLFTTNTISRDGFSAQAGFTWGRQEVAVQYTHLNLEQYFYTNGWESSPSVYVSDAQQTKNEPFLIGQVHKRQDDFSVLYGYQMNTHWRATLEPTYQYYQYNNKELDSGNHSHIVVGVQYANDIAADTSMGSLAEVSRKSRAYMLRELPASQWGKLAEVSYQAGGTWSGSDYDIHKISVGTALLWEQKKHHRLGLFVKAQRLFNGPFSNQVESADLLFGLGIYDRQQRGKAGAAAGISYTYFLVRNPTGLLSLMPFFEQAYLTDGGHAYTPHGGVGAIVTYQFWHIPWPISLNFTQNLNDGNHHIGFKIGGKF